MAPVTRLVSLPDGWLEQTEALLRDRYRLSWNEPARLAECVKRMSDFYLAHPLAATPWRETWCQVSQLIYYAPLNELRARAALREGLRFGFFEGLTNLVDFGAGLGPVSRALAQVAPGLPSTFVEISKEARELAAATGLSFQTAAQPQGRPGSLLACSYSLTELTSLPNWVFDFDSLLLIEPSTREDGRRLLGFRRELMAQGYQMWAPCPHQQACPLLEDSPTDWCHDRIHFERPEPWLKMEEHLPFRNATLTFSYLLASRRARPARAPEARTVGDLLKEKGKWRQLMCRGPRRQMAAWLLRHGEPAEVPRGVLVNDPGDASGGPEIRLTSGLVPVDSQA